MLKKYIFFVFLVLVTCFIWIAQINHSLFLFINAQHNILPTDIWNVINFITDPHYGVLPLALLILTFIFRREKLLNILLLIFAYYFFFQLLKMSIHEARPYIIYHTSDFFWIPLSHSDFAKSAAMRSFPSGHTGEAAIFVFGAIHLVTEPRKWLRGLLIGFLILVMLTRICTGWHFPLDVLVASLLGFILTEICWNLPLSRLFQKRA